VSAQLVRDHEELRRAIDAAPIEETLGALVRRAARQVALAEAAFNEASHEDDQQRLAELVSRCATSARVSRNISEAVHILAPGSGQDFEADAHARTAATFDRLANQHLGAVAMRRAETVGHA
jgi:hypothetical protein